MVNSHKPLESQKRVEFIAQAMTCSGSKRMIREGKMKVLGTFSPVRHTLQPLLKTLRRYFMAKVVHLITPMGTLSFTSGLIRPRLLMPQAWTQTNTAATHLPRRLQTMRRGLTVVISQNKI